MPRGKECEYMINYGKFTEDTVKKRLKDLKKNDSNALFRNKTILQRMQFITM